MRLLLTIGYQDVLFGEGVEVGKFLEVFEGMKIVKSEGYGAEKRYVIEEDASLNVELIPDDSVSLPGIETEQTAFLEKYHELAASRDKLRTEVCQLKKQLEEIQKAANPDPDEVIP